MDVNTKNNNKEKCIRVLQRNGGLQPSGRNCRESHQIPVPVAMGAYFAWYEMISYALAIRQNLGIGIQR